MVSTRRKSRQLGDTQTLKKFVYVTAPEAEALFIWPVPKEEREFTLVTPKEEDVPIPASTHDRSDPIVIVPQQNDEFLSPNPLEHQLVNVSTKSGVANGAEASPSKFTCKVCSHQLPSLYLLLRHLQKEHGVSEYDYTCDVCHRGFVTKKSLARHTRAYHGAKQQHTCTQCNKTVAYHSSLVRHVRIVHGTQRSSGEARLPSRSSLRGVSSHDFTCDLCDRGFKSKVSLARHIEAQHSGAKQHACSHCDKMFAYQCSLARHMRREHGIQRLVSEATLPDRSSLRRPKKKWRRPLETYQCDTCGKSFNGRMVFKRHLKVMHKTGPVACDVCGVVLSTRKGLKLHKKGQHGPNGSRFVCGICSTVFMKPCCLRKHIVGHRDELEDTGENKSIATHKYNGENNIDQDVNLTESLKVIRRIRYLYVCEFCEQRYASFRGFRAHMVLVHDSKATTADALVDAAKARIPVPPADETESHKTKRVKTTPAASTTRTIRRRRTRKNANPLQCLMCKETFATADDCLTHQHSAHTISDGIFVCPQCNKKFLLLIELQSHFRKKHGVEKVACPHCGKLFLPGARMQFHIRNVHEDNRQPCTHCGKLIKEMCMSKHVSQVHTERSIEHACEYCGKHFARKEGLQMHIKIHLGAKDHVCTLCGYASVTIYTLRRHMKRHMYQMADATIESLMRDYATMK